MSPKGLMRLGAFFNPTGHHVASWRHPRAQADAGINFKHYVEMTQAAERANRRVAVRRITPLLSQEHERN